MLCMEMVKVGKFVSWEFDNFDIAKSHHSPPFSEIPTIEMRMLLSMSLICFACGHFRSRNEEIGREKVGRILAQCIYK